jgi:hypothetical protein
LAAYLAEAYGADQARIMVRSWAGALSAVIDAGGDVSRSRATHITGPALLITGTYDPFCPPSLVREMADAIPWKLSGGTGRWARPPLVTQRLARVDRRRLADRSLERRVFLPIVGSRADGLYGAPVLERVSDK